MKEAKDSCPLPQWCYLINDPWLHPMLDDSTYSYSDSEITFIGFELSECVINVDAGKAKYLHAVHRTALELAVPNRFGIATGGFWLTTDQIEQLRRLPDHYPPGEAEAVAETIEIYLMAQCHLFKRSATHQNL